jgi:hypothetical protein
MSSFAVGSVIAFGLATACATTHGAHAATNDLEIEGRIRTQPAKGGTGDV